MAWWEFALLLIAIAIVVGTVYLVKLLIRVRTTVEGVNGLLAENKHSLDNIIANVDLITKDTTQLTDKANVITGEVESTVSVVKQEVVSPLIAALATVIKVVVTLANKNISR